MIFKGHRTFRQAGFSLVEMLFVLVILSILMVSASMVTTSVLRSTQLSTDSSALADELARAALDSVKTNQAIKVRFYRFSNPEFSGETLVQAYQMLTLDTGSSRCRELGNIRYFTPGIGVHESTEASTILTLPENTPVTAGDSNIVSDPELPTIAPYTYYEFEFRPDGSTNLPKDKTWGIVIAHNNGSKGEEVPANYRALGINPFTGSVKRY